MCWKSDTNQSSGLWPPGVACHLGCPGLLAEPLPILNSRSSHSPCSVPGAPAQHGPIHTCTWAMSCRAEPLPGRPLLPTCLASCTSSIIGHLVQGAAGWWASLCHRGLPSSGQNFSGGADSGHSPSTGVGGRGSKGRPEDPGPTECSF